MIRAKEEGNEIISLSFGHYSNWISAQLWNTLSYELESEETDPCVLFHTSANAKPKPRALLFDVKGSLSTMDARTIDNNESIRTWSGKADVVHAEDDVDPFAHLLHQANFHDKSLCELDTLRYSADNSFDFYSVGHAVLDEQSFMADDITDRFRYFSEQCDRLQGLQALVDVDSAYGGFASDFLAYVREEHSKVPIITFGITPHSNAIYTDQKAAETRTVNVGLSMQSLAAASSVYVPLSSQGWTSTRFPHLHLNASDPIHTSLIFASALNTLLLPPRLTPDHIPLTHYQSIHQLSSHMNIATLSTSFPFPLEFSPTMFHGVGGLHVENFMVPLSPGVRKEQNITPIAETIVLRGVSAQQLQPQQKAKQRQLFAEQLMKYVYNSYSCQLRTVSLADTFFHAHVPFTQQSSVIKTYNMETPSSSTIPTQPAQGDTVVPLYSAVPILTHLQTTRAISVHLQQIQKEFAECKHAFYNTYETKDDFKEIENELQAIADEYAND